MSNMQGQLFVVDPDTLSIVHCHEVAADQLLNMVYDRRQNRLFGVDQGIDRRDWRNNHLERDYVARSQGHEVFVLNADSAEIIARMATDEIPIGLVWDDEQERLYVANRRGIRVDKGKERLLSLILAIIRECRHYKFPLILIVWHSTRRKISISHGKE